MGYLSIENLYKHPEVISRNKEWYAMEKIHGTSANITYDNKQWKLHSGGSKSSKFVKLFDIDNLTERILALEHKFDKLIIYGEAYGPVLKMSTTYGSKLRFVAFDVNVDGKWYNVPDAEKLVLTLGLDFISYKKITSTIKDIDAARDEHSIQAIRNGLGEGKIREGIVLRPIEESIDKYNNRIIFKHKRSEFSEHKNYKKIGGVQSYENEDKIADDWVNVMRLVHVLQGLQKNSIDINYQSVISAMITDIEKESKGEFEMTLILIKKIKNVTGKLYTKYLKDNK
jgi:hypothetical protein